MIRGALAFAISIIIASIFAHSLRAESDVIRICVGFFVAFWVFACFERISHWRD